MTNTGTGGRGTWKSALDRLTEEHEGELVTIQLLDETYGANEEVERLPFVYANYDDKDDVVIVAVGGRAPRYPVVLRHLVWHPTEVDVATDDVVTAMRAVDGDGTATVITFFPERAG
jgi:hypothetical protein